MRCDAFLAELNFWWEMWIACKFAITIGIIAIAISVLIANFTDNPNPMLKSVIAKVKFVSIPYLSRLFGSTATMVKYLGQEEAIKVDEELFNDYKFSVDQLMELAGLSVATTVATLYGEKKRRDPVLVICGPGNNGGDGLVAARHLKLFGFTNVTLLNAKKPTKDLFVNLIRQAELNDVRVSYDPAEFKNIGSLGLIIDALFGFSFKPPVRPDFEPLMKLLTQGSAQGIPVVSVDIPSGWNVEKGPPGGPQSFMPETLISLTAPKLCATHFKGQHHFLGGRFVPRQLAEKYGLNLPEYPRTDCIVRL